MVTRGNKVVTKWKQSVNKVVTNLKQSGNSGNIGNKVVTKWKTNW